MMRVRHRYQTLESAVFETQGLMLEMLKARFESVVDTLLEYMVAGKDGPNARHDALFDLYHDGILTKGEVARRSGIPEEHFYEEVRAHRIRKRHR
jgi:hypothetical protein